jgi:hypothetical protein
MPGMAMATKVVAARMLMLQLSVARLQLLQEGRQF